MNSTPDPLEQLLQPPKQPAADDLRRRLREQTSRLVDRRRILRRSLTLAAALAACLAALMATYFVVWWPRQTTLEKLPVAVVPEPPVQEFLAVEEPVSPLDMEWRAFDSQEDRAANYFAAGNKYFEANDDLESALRCYSQALDACAPEQLEVAPDDNWLVASLKTARLKEKEND